MIDSKQHTRRYELAANTIGKAETEAAIEVLLSGQLTMGRRVREFEEAFAEWTGATFAVMTNSGSSANLLAVEARLRGVRSDPSRWHPGDEVIVPAFAWPTTVWPLVQLGLVPVLVDVDPDTLAINLESAAAVVGPRTVGMVLIHVLGQAPDMHPYEAFCEERDLVLIEDACESLGARIGGRHVGTFGEMGTFSTYFSHHITTIEGGVVVTSDEEVYDDLKSMRSHGWVRDRSDRAALARDAGAIDDRFLFVTTGYNFRPTEVNAAIGLVQLERLSGMLESRVRLAERVADWVGGIPWLRLVGAEHVGPDRSHSWMALPFEVGLDAPIDAAHVTGILENSGVATRPVIAGNLANHPAMAQVDYRRATELPVADRVFSRYFMLGCHPDPSQPELDTLEEALSRLASL